MRKSPGRLTFIVIACLVIASMLFACSSPAPAPAAKEAPKPAEQAKPAAPAPAAKPAEQAKPAAAAPAAKPAAAEKGAPYKIGAFYSMTGPNAAIGIPGRDAMKLIEEEINAAGGMKGLDGKLHPLEIIVYDDGTDETKAVMATKKLLEEDKVLAISAAASTGLSMATLPLIDKAETIGFLHGSTTAIVQPVKKWIFKTAPITEILIETAMEYMKKNNITKIALLTDNGGFGTSGRDAAVKMAPQYGINIVARETFAPTDTDMTAQLTRIKGTDAQALYVWSVGAVVNITKNFKQLGMNIQFIDSQPFASNPQLVSQAGDAANGVVAPVGKLGLGDQLAANDPLKPVVQNFEKIFKAKYNKPAEQFAGFTYDATRIMVQALEKVGPDKAKMRDYIETLKGFKGVTDTYNYSPTNHYGLTKDSQVMIRIQNGKPTVIK